MSNLKLILKNARGLSLIEAMITVGILTTMAIGAGALMSEMTRESARLRRSVSRTTYEQKLVALYKNTTLCTCNLGGATPISVPAAGPVTVPGLKSGCATATPDVYDSSVVGGFQAEPSILIENINISTPVLVSGNDYRAFLRITYGDTLNLGNLKYGEFWFFFTKTVAAGPPYIVASCTMGGSTAVGGATTGWSLGGNAGTTATDFLGTADNNDVVFKRNNVAGGAIRLNAVAWGVNAILNNTTGTSNTGLGFNSLAANTTGSNNIGIGNDAGGNAASAFRQTTGSYNTYIGENAGPGAAALSNSSAIGRNAKVDVSDTLVIGGPGADGLKVGVGTTVPTASFDVTQTFRTNADPIQTAWSTLNISPTAALTNYAKGAFYTWTEVTNAPFDVDRVSGVTTSATSLSSSAVTDIYGTMSEVLKQGSGSTGSVLGLYAYAQASAGPANSLSGAYMNTRSNATVTNMYGQYVQLSTLSGGPVTNRHGYYISAPQFNATNEYGFYQAGSAQKNYFAGPVGIGPDATAPAGLFEIRGSTTFDPIKGKGVFIQTQDGPSGGRGGNMIFNLGSAAGNTGATGGFRVTAGTFTYIPAPAMKLTATPWNNGGVIAGENIAARYSIAPMSDGIDSPAQISIGVRGATSAAGFFNTIMGFATGTETRAYVADMGGGAAAQSVTGIQAVAGGPGNTGTIDAGYGGYFAVGPATGTITNGYGVYIGTVTGTSRYALYASTAPSYFAGNVGVGTVATEKLHVLGLLRVQGSTDCTLGGAAGGTMCSSDIRLKSNVKEIEDPLEKIRSLRGIEFEWNGKSRSPGRHAIGVIAQEVEKVFPTAVMTEPSTGFKKVDYAVLVAPVIQALKVLSHEIFELLFSVTTLNRELDSVEEKIVKIENENALAKMKLESLESQMRFTEISNCKPSGAP